MTARVGTSLRPGRPSGMCSSGKCSRIRSHWSSRSRSMHVPILKHIHAVNNFEIGSSNDATAREALKVYRQNMAVTTNQFPTRYQVRDVVIEVIGAWDTVGLSASLSNYSVISTSCSFASMIRPYIQMFDLGTTPSQSTKSVRAFPQHYGILARG